MGVLEEALESSALIDGKDPIVWAIQNDKKIEGQDPIVWAIQNNRKIEGKDPATWKNERGYNKGDTKEIKELLDRKLRNQSTYIQSDDEKNFNGIIKSSPKSQGYSSGWVGKTPDNTETLMVKYADKTVGMQAKNTLDMQAKKRSEERKDINAEYMFEPLYKRFLYNQAPDIQLMVQPSEMVGEKIKFLEEDPNQKTVAVTSRFFKDDFNTLIDFMRYKSDKLMEIKGFEKVIAACVILGEDDYHYENVGVINQGTEDKPYYLAVKIDHGSSGSYVFTNEAVLRSNLVLQFNELSYNQMPFNAEKFKNAIDEMVKISEEELRGHLYRREATLAKLGFSVDTSILSKFWKDGVSAKDTGNTATDVYAARILQNIKTAKELSKTLDIILKIDIPDVTATANAKEKFKNGEWLESLGNQDPIIWAYKKGYTVVGKSAIEFILESGDLELLEKLIKELPPYEILFLEKLDYNKFSDKCSDALDKGYLNIINAIINNYPNLLNKLSDDKKTELFFNAIRDNHINIVTALLANNVDSNILNATDGSGKTPLQLAIENKQIFIINAIFKNASKEITFNLINRLNEDEKKYLLLNASKNSWSNIIEALLQDVNNLGLFNTKDGYGYTTLHLAALYNNVDAISAILDKAGEHLKTILKATDENGQTPLHLAAQSDNVDAISAILDKAGKYLKTILKATDENGQTPLHLAAQSDNIDAISAILDKAGKYLKTILKATDENGQTPLHLAAQSDNVDAISAILDKAGEYLKTILKATDENGQTPLHLAARSGNIEAIKAILDKAGENLETILKATDENGQTPLHLAAKEGDTKMVKLLLENGANVNIADNKERTPLYLAAKKGNAKMVGIILKNAGEHLGAILETKDNKGLTPLEVAENSGKTEVANVIEKAMKNLSHEQTEVKKHNSNISSAHQEQKVKQKIQQNML